MSAYYFDHWRGLAQERHRLLTERRGPFSACPPPNCSCGHSNEFHPPAKRPSGDYSTACTLCKCSDWDGPEIVYKEMTRTDHYAAGFSEGCRWAEQDIRDGMTQFPNYRTHGEAYTEDWYRADVLGWIRGYRDTVARFEAGTLTFEMFENAPL